MGCSLGVNTLGVDASSWITTSSYGGGNCPKSAPYAGGSSLTLGSCAFSIGLKFCGPMTVCKTLPFSLQIKLKTLKYGGGPEVILADEDRLRSKYSGISTAVLSHVIALDSLASSLLLLLLKNKCPCFIQT